MFTPLCSKAKRKILFTYDIHRNNQLFLYKYNLNFKKYFKDYPFYGMYSGTPQTERSLELWLEKSNLNEDFDSTLKHLFLQVDGVIGFELPDNMKNFLIENSIPYINYNISCYRCCFSNYFALETDLNISNFFIPIKEKFISVNLDIGTLLIGQMPADKVLVRKNKLISLIDYENIFDRLPKPIYFAPHPYGDEELLRWAENKNFIIVNHSTYELLESRPKLVCGINSSILYEARDLWNLPVLFLDELQEARNYLHLPEEIAFDHEIIDALLTKNQLEAKILIANKYSEIYLNK